MLDQRTGIVDLSAVDANIDTRTVISEEELILAYARTVLKNRDIEGEDAARFLSLFLQLEVGERVGASDINQAIEGSSTVVRAQISDAMPGLIVLDRSDPYPEFRLNEKGLNSLVVHDPVAFLYEAIAESLGLVGPEEFPEDFSDINLPESITIQGKTYDLAMLLDELPFYIDELMDEDTDDRVLDFGDDDDDDGREKKKIGIPVRKGSLADKKGWKRLTKGRRLQLIEESHERAKGQIEEAEVVSSEELRFELRVPGSHPKLRHMDGTVIQLSSVSRRLADDPKLVVGVYNTGEAWTFVSIPEELVPNAVLDLVWED